MGMLRRGMTIGLVALVAIVAIGHFMGTPVLLSYVETGSMEPEIEAGDGFVVLPAELAGSPSEGSVVIYDARETDGGGLTTHRIVGETPEGYVTAGDANPFTDQDGGEPPVGDEQIVGIAPQVNGNVLTIPALGSAAMALEGVAERAVGGSSWAGIILVAIGTTLVLAGAASGGRERSRTRDRKRPAVLRARTLIVGAALLLVVLATMAMVLPAGSTEYEVGAMAEPTADPLTVEPGEVATVDRSIENAGLLPIVSVIEPRTQGVSVEPDRERVGIRGETTTTVHLEAPKADGETVHRVTEYRYIGILPASVLVGLHSIHPVVALLAVNSLIVVGAAAVVIAAFGRGQIRLRSSPFWRRKGF